MGVRAPSGVGVGVSGTAAVEDIVGRADSEIDGDDDDGDDGVSAESSKLEISVEIIDPLAKVIV
jgi:hypothetical protein